MSRILIAGTAIAVAACVLGQEAKIDFSGTWKPEAQAAKTFVVKQTADEIHIQEMGAGSNTVSEVKCGYRGQECPAKVDGGNAKVVLYYNGPSLVQITTRDKKVYRTRWTMSSDGEKVTVETISIVPQGKTDTVVLVRAKGSDVAVAK